MTLVNVHLTGGPPWGMRITQNEEMEPLIGKVLPGGRADVFQIKIGDRIESVNGERVQTCGQAHSKIQESDGEMRMELMRYPGSSHIAIRNDHLSTSVRTSPVPQITVTRTATSVPSSPVAPRTNPFVSRGDRTHWKGGTNDKKRYFEAVTGDLRPFVTDRLLQKKIQMGIRTPEAQSDSISTVGYDSVGGDFAGRRSGETSGRETPTPSVDNERLLKMEFPNNASSSPLDDDDLKPFGYGAKELEKIVEQQMQSQPSWGMKAEVNNAGNASGTVEIPGRRSVAELTMQLANRLEVKAPSGQTAGRPKTPSNSNGIQLGRVLDGNGSDYPSNLSNIVKVHEPAADIIENNNKPYLGRVLDGPPKPDQYYQGVPPSSAVMVASPVVARKTPNITQSFLKTINNTSKPPSLSQNFQNGVHRGLANNCFAEAGISRHEVPRQETKTPTNMFRSNGFDVTNNNNSNNSNYKQDIYNSSLTNCSQDPSQQVNGTNSHLYWRSETKTPTLSAMRSDSIQSPTPSSCYSSALSQSTKYTTPPTNFGRSDSQKDESKTPTPGDGGFNGSYGQTPNYNNGYFGEYKTTINGNPESDSSESYHEEQSRTKVPPRPPPKPVTPVHFAPQTVDDLKELYDFTETDSVRSSTMSELASITRCEPVISRTHIVPNVQMARMTPVVFDKISENYENDMSPNRLPVSSDLESYESIRSNQFSPYSTLSNDHFGTIRRGKASLVSPVESPAGKVSYSFSNRTTDSGFDESQLKSPSIQDSLDTNRAVDGLNDSYSIDSRMGDLSVTTYSDENGNRPMSVESQMTHEEMNGLSNEELPEKRPANDYDMSTWYRNMYKKMHKVDNLQDPSILKYYVRDQSSTAPNSVNRPWTPSGRLEGTLRSSSRPEFEASIQPRRAKSVGRTFENEGGPHSPNRYAFERARTAHFHLPVYRLREEDNGSHSGSHSGPPCLRMGDYCGMRSTTDTNKCSRCGWPLKDPTWDEIEEMYAKMDVEFKKRPKPHRGKPCEAVNSAITEKLDQTAEDLENFIRELDNCWKRSFSSPILSSFNRPKESPFNVSTELVELKKLSREEQMYREKAERLTEELEAQRSRRHGYVPSAAPALQKNVDRFTGLLNNYGRESPSLTRLQGLRDNIVSPSPSGRKSAPPVNVITATAIYSFKPHSERELPLNKGDIIRIHREIDNNWIEGERNGRVGIFPRSYIQVESEFERTKDKFRVVYPFTARNSNEMSLKIGELVTFRREIDTNWMEGTNHIGEIGIFPSCYVRRMEEVEEALPEVVPDRPKTPHVPQIQLDRERTPANREEPVVSLPNPIPNTFNTPLKQEPTPSHQPQIFNIPITRQDNVQPNSSGYGIQNGYSQPTTAKQESQQNGHSWSQDYDEDRSEHCDKMAAWQEKRQNDYTGSAHLVPQNSETFRAVYAYKPCNEDELELQVNDIVFVVEKCDDGWFIGTLLRTGQFGTFPGNYVIRH